MPLALGARRSWSRKPESYSLLCEKAMKVTGGDSVDHPACQYLFTSSRAGDDEWILVVVKVPAAGKVVLVSHVNPFEKVRLLKFLRARL